MMNVQRVPPWFWVAWPLVSVASIASTKQWPAAEAAWLPLLAGALWLAARRWSAPARGLVACLIAGAFATLVVTLFVPTVVADASSRSAVPFGWPLSWVTQDLSAFDPPYPYPMSVDTVGRSTGMPAVSAFAFVVNTLLYAAVAAAGTVMVRRLARRDRESRGQHTRQWQRQRLAD